MKCKMDVNINKFAKIIVVAGSEYREYNEVFREMTSFVDQTLKKNHFYLGS
jgi:hypothetical protein